MNVRLHPCFIITLAVLPWTTVPQSPVPLQFQVSPVLVASGNNGVFVLQTISNTFSIAWIAPGGSTLGQWIGGQAVLNSVAQYQGRITITATQLTISSSQLGDAGNYTVTVVPSASTGLSTSSLSVALRVYNAVSQVSLFVPSVAIEGGNVSLQCSWAQGTQTTVAWGKDGSALTSSARITINGGSLIINPASRSDAGQYTCTVSNPVSTQTATATLTVYYGPDTPQVTESSSNCVGGGDATVGQTVQLTCTSVSLPPALLSWSFNGNQLTASQTSGGTLNLQVFSTNQSGQYTCTAHNTITTGSSLQQISLSIVGTCLSVGAVAGIVVACFVTLVLIIVAIVLVLRQRNVDRRLRAITGHQKTNLNNGPPVLPAPQNGPVASGVIGNGDQPDPPLHNLNRLNLPKNQETEATVWHTGQENNRTLTQSRVNGTNINAGTLLNNDNHNSNAHSYNNRQNSNSYPHNGLHNSSFFPQSAQQNPNILIQTGRGEPGSQTVLINLNPQQHLQSQNAPTQPHTVQVSLGPVQPSPGQPDHRVMRQNGQPNGTLPQQLANTGQQNQPHVGGSHFNAQAPVGNVHNVAPTALNSTLGNGDQEPSELIQTGYSHHNEQNLTSRHSSTTHRSPELSHRRSNDTRSRSPEMSSTSSHLRQMPWDLLRGTPAYPNPQENSSESSNSSEYPTVQPQRGRSSPTPRQSLPVDVQSGSSGARRNVWREIANSIVQRSSRKKDTQLSVGGHQHQTALQNAVSQSSLVQTQSTQNAGVSQRARVPQSQTTQGQTVLQPSVSQNSLIQTHGTQNSELTQRARVPQSQTTPRQTVLQQTSQGFTNQTHGTQNAGVSHRARTPQDQTTQGQTVQRPQTVRQNNSDPPNSIPLTHAALQVHTTHISNPFSNRNEQTRAALQRPGPGSKPVQPSRSQPHHTTQMNKTRPTPPPVLRPTEFRTLPREPLRQPRPMQPAHVMRQPHGQRPHGHARAMHTSPQRHQHMPTNAHRQGPDQVHRSRARL